MSLSTFIVLVLLGPPPPPPPPRSLPPPSTSAGIPPPPLHPVAGLPAPPASTPPRTIGAGRDLLGEPSNRDVDEEAGDAGAAPLADEEIAPGPPRDFTCASDPRREIEVEHWLHEIVLNRGHSNSQLLDPSTKFLVEPPDLAEWRTQHFLGVEAQHAPRSFAVIELCADSRIS